MNNVETCYHCGNATPMERVATYNIHDSFEGMYSDTNYDIFLCPVCRKVTLSETYLFSEDISHVSYEGVDDEYRQCEIEAATRKTILYPATGLDDHFIPEDVYKAFEAALRVRNIDSTICVMALRRALEKMCKHKDAQGKYLHNKIDSLQKQKILPDIVGEMAYLLKDEGNSAVHGDHVEFDEKKVELLIHFTRVILSYVYTIPEQLKQIKGEMDMEIEST